MIEYECPTCCIPLRIPVAVMGKSGTCIHCGAHFQLPTLWRYRFSKFGPKVWAAFLWIAKLPFAIAAHLVAVNSGPDEFAGMSQAERLLVQEARKQTKIQRSARSDTSCCLGCIIILLILFFMGALGPILAIIGIGGAIGAAQ